MKTQFQTGDRGALKDWPSLVLIQTEAQRAEVMASAEEDGHRRQMYPTHAVVKCGEVVGCSSIGNVPLVHTWLHREKLAPRDTLRVFYLMENFGRSIGIRWFAVPSPRGAPLHGHLEKDLGYEQMGEHFLFAKNLLANGTELTANGR